MKRFQSNPILEPVGTNKWESRRVFNAAILNFDKKIHILYRAMGHDGISRLGYAASSDGYHIDERLHVPIFEPANDAEKDGCEDPRLTMLDDTLVMAYTAYGNYSCQGVYQVSLTSIPFATKMQRSFLRNSAENMLCSIVLNQISALLILMISDDGTI